MLLAFLPLLLTVAPVLEAAPLAPHMAMAMLPKRRYRVSVPLPPPAAAPPLPRIVGPADDRLPLVVIDAGHGGHDPGALADEGRVEEKDVTLALARAARDALVATGRLRVALTREDDRFLVLEERYELARRLGATLFVSVHADSAADPTASGAAIFTLSDTASDREAARLAARENRADHLGNVDLGGRDAAVRAILLDLAQRESGTQSVAFARRFLRAASTRVPMRINPLRSAGFVVLKAPDQPAALIEVGFLSNAEDLARMTSVEGREAFADALRDAVLVDAAARRLAR